MSVREKLAEYAHTAWSGWMVYLFEKCEGGGTVDGVEPIPVVIPGWAVERWQRQMNTPYADLPENEKESDRAEADRMLAICLSFLLTVSKRETPPDVPGNYYFQWPALVARWDKMAYCTVVVTQVEDGSFGLFGSVINLPIPELTNIPLVYFPEGTWWGPLPLPEME